MKNKLITAISLLLILLLIGCNSDKNAKVDVESQISSLKNTEGNIYVNENPEYQKMTDWLLYEVKETNLRGSVIVATDDEIIFASGTRLLDIDGNEVTPYTTYEIGSITKSFTATCIMKLIEEGKLSIDDTLGDFFPEYNYCSNYEKVSSITVSDLLHMRSGLPDYLNAPEKYFNEELVLELSSGDFRSKSAADRLSSFFSNIDDNLFLENTFGCVNAKTPNTEYEYSNTNYYLLSLIIEQVTGHPYGEYITETILEPCNMSSSTSMVDGNVTASFKENGFMFEIFYTKGAGDIHSNVVDLLKFERALFGGYLLNEESMNELLKPIDSYGCGWFIKDDEYYHGGATPAFATEIHTIDRKGKRLYIIMFANQGENRADVISEYLSKWFETEE